MPDFPSIPSAQNVKNEKSKNCIEKQDLARVVPDSHQFDVPAGAVKLKLLLSKVLIFEGSRKGPADPGPQIAFVHSTWVNVMRLRSGSHPAPSGSIRLQLTGAGWRRMAPDAAPDANWRRMAPDAAPDANWRRMAPDAGAGWQLAPDAKFLKDSAYHFHHSSCQLASSP